MNHTFRNLLLFAAAAGLAAAQTEMPPMGGMQEMPADLAGVMGMPGLPGMPGAVPAAGKLTVKGAANVQSYKEGTPFLIALNGEVESPWHAYWKNPGTVGEPMEAKLDTPAGFEVSGPYWSAPEWHNGVIGAAYVYEHPVVVWQVTPKAGAPDKASFTVTATAQVCSDEGCLPAETVSATVELGKGDAAAAADWQGQEKQVAGLNEAPLNLSAKQTADTVTLILKDKPQSARFFDADSSFDGQKAVSNIINPTAEQKYDPATGELTLPRNDGKDPMYPTDETVVSAPVAVLNGVLVADGVPHTVSLNMADMKPGFFEMLAEVPDGIIALCGALFLGGLILNLMPCVFPVIGLKVMSFVEMAGGSKKKVLLHSFTFVAGILASFWVLSALLVILLPSGDRNWAMWMQNPWIVYAILLLLFCMGLNMSGVFEIGVSATGAAQGVQSKGGLIGAFLQGLFVTVVATPCAAPFLGTYLPIAMALPDPWLIIALTFMGLGLSFPYIVLGFFPSLVRLLPQPGEWMISLKQGLAFLLYAAAAWFLYIYMAFFSVELDIMWMMISLVAIAAALWVYGRWCPMYCSMKSRIIGGIVALALAGVGVFYSMPRTQVDAPAAAETQAMPAVAHDWVAWSPKAMEEALAAGKPVYVDFTAKWCATCQSNKSLAYTDEVYARFAQAGTVLMRADKTKPNAEIDAEMRRLKRSSVPVNALYLPKAEPIITREVFGSDYMMEFLETNLPKELPAAPAADDEDDEDDDLCGGGRCSGGIPAADDDDDEGDDSDEADEESDEESDDEEAAE